MSFDKKKLVKIIKTTAMAMAVAFAGLCFISKKKKSATVYENEPEQKNPLEGKKVVFVEDESEPENADGARGHLEAVGDSDYRPGFYEKCIKRALDVILSFGGLVVLSPIYAGIALAIVIDDPGPVLFTQKRMGQNKKYFKLHKFRSMKMSTPHDVPTHMLDNPEQYITRVGKFLRAHSLDELPQIWDIFVGNMSVIGPRPGLWNQDILTAERDKYNANDVKPGLTGWAQINGRDELEIPVKAKLDGEYVKKMGPLMDLKCFLGSVGVFAHDDSVVEGGTGEMKKAVGRHYTDGKTAEELIGHIGFGEPVEVDTETKKKVLITGAGSYIGETFRAYAAEHYPALEIDAVDMLDASWREKDFSEYDIVYHVAGIAHADVGNVDEATKAKYYAVNTDLAVEVCEKAKAEGVKEFVFMSSMIVYGDSAPYGKKKVVDEHTVPKAANFYGDSKLQADVAVRGLADDDFKVIVLRPPMIYGKGSKGNYPTLAKLAKKLPVFPNVDNERSMLHINNLCEFLCQIMLVKEVKENAIVLIPQNGEWTKTSEMVKEIGEVSGKKVRLVGGIMKPAVWIGGKVPGKIGGMVNKAFGNSVYKHEISLYSGVDYQNISLKESIKMTESNSEKKKVLFLVNHDVVIYNFRLELVERLLDDGYEVHISSPYGERIDELKELGAIFHEINMDRHGMNPISEGKLLLNYRKLLAEVKPDIILGYTIKPNIYGAMAASEKNIPFVANITGLGTAVENPGMSQKLMVLLYKIAFRKVQKVFFQNKENQQFFIAHNIAIGKQGLLPGSGVNLTRFAVEDYPKDDIVRFAFISRIMKEKGIDQYLDAAKFIKEKYPNTEFHVCGFCEKEYEGKLNEYNDNGTVIYHGMIHDVAGFLENMNCVVHPTYYPEGLSNVLLEASACGRPIITTDRSGCMEVVDDGINGYMIPQKNSEKLIEAIDRFMNLSYEEKRGMGLAARKKVEENFDRSIVVEAYMREIK
ncbi:MAG: sugar transferase [Lachnospiraceae bacterium]